MTFIRKIRTFNVDEIDGQSELPESFAQEEVDERVVSGCRFAEETSNDPES